jgi:hypothetical protein
MLHSLSKYLERFKKLQPPKEYKKERIQEIIKEKSGVLVDKEKINLKGTLLHLTVSPLYKTEILLHQEEILKSLEEERLKVTKFI